jgi:sulfofructosephosphate aldolase
MPLDPADLRARFADISLPSGGLAMVAMDQRESLRTMFHTATNADVPDDTLSDFKLAVTEVLTPHASAILLDPQWGEAAMRVVAPTCGLVVAADKLTQNPGELVQDTDVDPSITPQMLRDWGAKALKLLVIWRYEDDAERRKDVVQRFMDLSHAAGALGIVEGVVRAPAEGAFDRDTAIFDAAVELGGMNPDLYKAEVPTHGKGSAEEIQRRCKDITNELHCPWVVLSSGVSVETFPGAVEAACKGGASGFLAGRGIWMDLVGPGDYRQRLQDTAVGRLQRLREVVEEHAQPWSGKVSG